jgi:hypothetical protein
MCEYLTRDTKIRIFNTAERDEQGSKVAEFFEHAENMFDEMKWQKKLRGKVGSRAALLLCCNDFFELFFFFLFFSSRSTCTLLGEQSHGLVESDSVQRGRHNESDRCILLSIFNPITRYTANSLMTCRFVC